ncbi:MAG TPA: acylphosphatase [Rudaea sp.]|nr:acylphosphatase [Rudaea sp.]
MACVRYIVHGRVQGVFFRASARDEAVRLGLTGCARNLADGRVEVLACGEPAAIAELERWLHHGPPLARVTSVERVAVDARQPRDFQVA